jgi:hypothetical protein
MVMTIDWGALLAGDASPPKVGAGDTAPKREAEEVTAAGQTAFDAGIAARETEGDNRRRCAECGNLAEHGLCLAARRGEIGAARSYTPERDRLRRCEGFAPLPTDPDQCPPAVRWPGLIAAAQQAEAGQQST